MESATLQTLATSTERYPIANDVTVIPLADMMRELEGLVKG